MICNLITMTDGRMMCVIRTSIWLVLQDVLCDFIRQAFCNVLQNNIHAGMFYRLWIIRCIFTCVPFLLSTRQNTSHWSIFTEQVGAMGCTFQRIIDLNEYTVVTRVRQKVINNYSS